MTKPGWLSRRSFAQMAVASAFTARSRWLSAAVKPEILTPWSGLAFVGSFDAPQGVHVYAVTGNQWRLRQVATSEAPVSLALHPNGRWLYVLNEISEYRGLPCGSVESFRFDEEAGQLMSIGRQALSLSATMPRHIGITPDGQALVVAVHGGGAYNLLPILSDGRAGRVTSVIKETGCGPVAKQQESAHPQSVIFDSTGSRFLASDLGADRISVFSCERGFEVQSRFDLPAGSGPRHLALHPKERFLYVTEAIDNAVSGFRYDSESGTIKDRLTSTAGGCAEALAMHPSGHFLYTAGNGEIAAWSVDSSSGALNRVRSSNLALEPGTSVYEMRVLPDGRALLVLTNLGVTRAEIDPHSGRLFNMTVAAVVPDARSIAMRSLNTLRDH